MLNGQKLIFVVDLIFGDFLWGVVPFVALATLIGIFNAELHWKALVQLLILDFFICYIFKIIKTAVKWHNNPPQHLLKFQALSVISGDGAFEGIQLIVLRSVYSLQTGTIMTLYCGSSGAIQPIALLKVIPYTADSKCVYAVRVFPEPSNLNRYFEEESRRKALFAIPICNANEFGVI